MKKLQKYFLITCLIVLNSACSHLPESWNWDEISDDLSSIFKSDKSTEQSQQQVEVVHTDFQKNINTFFANAIEGEQQFFRESPWGVETVLMIERRYHSAGGRECIEFVIMHDTAKNMSIACEASQNNWVEVRPVIKMEKLQ